MAEEPEVIIKKEDMRVIQQKNYGTGRNRRNWKSFHRGGSQEAV